MPTNSLARLIELDEAATAKEKERVEFLSLTFHMLEALPDGLVVTDGDGKVFLFNQQAEFMFGYHRSEVIGQSVEMLLPVRANGEHVEHRARCNFFDLNPHALTLGQGLRVTGRRSDGHEFPVDITLARMIEPVGVFNMALFRHSPLAAMRAAAVTPPSGNISASEAPHGHS
ncbi:MAG: PAS domain S-box protein [Acetobacteraceae bacterium]|nr:PAS domain S-box protein [Acetobacteraceae bacterium]